MENRTCETCNNSTICKYKDNVTKNISNAKKSIQNCETLPEPNLITIIFDCKHYIGKMEIEHITLRKDNGDL